MDDLNKRLGQKISFLRKQFNMTQEQLSEQTSLSQNFLSQLETGRKTPSILTLSKISGAINVPLSMLFDGQEPCKNISNTAYSLDKKLLRAFCKLSKTEKKFMLNMIEALIKKRKPIKKII